MGKTLLEVTVKETKKRRHPSKFYVSRSYRGNGLLLLTLPLYPSRKVYVLEVTWSEGTSTVIYRRYSDFFEFQVS